MSTINEIQPNVFGVPRYFCEEQSYGVFFKLKNSAITLEVDVYADGEIELTEPEVAERGLNVLLNEQSHLTSDKIEFVNAELYSKKYSPIAKIYEKQEYTVKFRSKGGDVWLNIKVEFHNQPVLTDDEIFNAAYKLIEESIEIEGEFFREDIILNVSIENPTPVFPFLNVIRPDDRRKEMTDEEMTEFLTAKGYKLNNAEGEVTIESLSEVAIHSENFQWDEKRKVWFK